MVLVVEVLLGVGILVGVHRVATRDGHLAPPFEPDGPAVVTDDRLLSAEDVAGFRLPWGIGYRRADVDRLLDRLARQLPRAGEEPAAEPPAASHLAEASGRVPLTKSSHGSQEDGHG